MQQLTTALHATTTQLTASAENIKKIQSQLHQVEQQLAASQAAMADLLQPPTAPVVVDQARIFHSIARQYV